MSNHITEQAKDATQNGQPQTAPNPTKPHRPQPTAITAQHRYTANHSDTITATANCMPYSFISLYSHKTPHSLRVGYIPIRRRRQIKAMQHNDI